MIKESFFLNLIKKIITLFNRTKFEFIIKPHPATRINFDDELKKYVKISKQNFYKLLSTSDIVISGGTTATIEASIMNKEVIIMEIIRISSKPFVSQDKKDKYML